MSAQNIRKLIDLLEGFNDVNFGQWVEFTMDSLSAVSDALHRDSGEMIEMSVGQFEDTQVFYDIISSTPGTPGNHSPQAMDPDEYYGSDGEIEIEVKYVLLFNDQDQMLAMPFDKLNSTEIKDAAETAALDHAYESANNEPDEPPEPDFDPRY